MTDPQAGDLVTASRAEGTWVVMYQLDTSPQWRLRKQRDDRTSLEIIRGQGDMVLLVRPMLTPGMIVMLDDGVEATVESADSETVHLALPASARRSKLPCIEQGIDRFVDFGPGAAAIAIGALVAMNVQQFLRQGQSA